MPIHRYLLGLVLCAPVAAVELPDGCVFTDSPGQDATLACYADLDTDGDGALSPAEAEVLPRIQGRFEALDADGNGQLSPAEFQGDQTTPPQRGGAKGV
jgi:hypothetical protein